MCAHNFIMSLTSLQARVIDSCLRLHGQLCPPEMTTFHGTMEKFFRKNFAEEIQRLAMDGSHASRSSDQISPASKLSPVSPQSSYVYLNLSMKGFSFRRLQAPVTWCGASTRGQRHGITSSIPAFSTRKWHARRRYNFLQANNVATTRCTSCTTWLQRGGFGSWRQRRNRYYIRGSGVSQRFNHDEWRKRNTYDFNTLWRVRHGFNYGKYWIDEGQVFENWWA